MSEIKYGKITKPVGKSFPSRFTNELQQQIEVQLQDGTREKIYVPAGDPRFTSMKFGQDIKVTYEPKQNGGTNKVLSSVSNGQGQRQTSLPHNTVLPTANNFINKRIEIFTLVYATVSDKFPKFSDESKRALATSILIEGKQLGINFDELLKTQIEPPPHQSYSGHQQGYPEFSQSNPQWNERTPQLPYPNNNVQRPQPVPATNQQLPPKVPVTQFHNYQPTPPPQQPTAPSEANYALNKLDEIAF